MSPSPHALAFPDISASARQKIDDEIAHLEARIATLRTTRNTLTSFARLHNEVIQEIFILASGDPMDGLQETEDEEPEDISIGIASLRISWVCRSWRELAHQTSELWNYIDFIHPTWVEAALSRTRNRWLYFSLFLPSNYHDNPDRLASLCLRNLPRICRLYIHSEWDSELDIFTRLSPLWVTPAPLLVDLNLGSVSLPQNLFSGTFPSLRQLSLRNCEFGWEWLPIQANLRSLYISSPVVRISAEELLAKLQGLLSEMEDLALQSVLLPTVLVIPHSLQSTHVRQQLAKLTSLHLMDENASPVNFMLNHFSLPSYLDHLTVVTHEGMDQLGTVEALVSCRGLEKWPVNGLHIILEEESIRIITVLEWNSAATLPSAEDVDEARVLAVPESASHPSKSSYISLTVEMFEDFSDIRHLLDILPLSPIKELNLDGGHLNDYGPHLTDHFDEQGGVERLRINVSYLPTFTGVIYMQNRGIRNITRYDNGPGVPGEEPLDAETEDLCRFVLHFDHLTTLEYYGRYGFMDEDKEELIFARVYYMMLWEWLKWRRTVGLGLKKLVFQNMHIPPREYLRALYDGVVDEVEFGRVEEVTDKSTAIPFNP
ncbi:hypothetical protein BDN72DRAFT_959351 [Pluteus cervinus]|uniref:Uncharacterized protein n=1 Tax=Pluteus cervinus TaxID=181527 RepID=A0ACD3AV82_9AGAR|nr:hypothetical protein BDN72DRAFT_959351 [Pluteus cervinus]